MTQSVWDRRLTWTRRRRGVWVSGVGHPHSRMLGDGVEWRLWQMKRRIGCTPPSFTRITLGRTW